MRRRRVLIAAAAAVSLATAVGGSAAHAATAKSTVRLVCNGSTARCPEGSHYTTIQSAVNAARSGDWILVWPGVYHEKATSNSGVYISKPNLHLRGMDRNKVVIDGSNGTAANPCPTAASQQDFTARSGIVMWKADNVSIENLTVCNYLADTNGHQGNEIWWNGGDGSGQIGIHRYHGAYLTATSEYAATDSSGAMGQYGIFSSNATGPADLTDTYASNMGDSDYYVGACRDVCHVDVVRAHGENSALGFSGTNAGGYVIRDSEFDNNRTGIAPNSLNNDDSPPPQNGSCSYDPAKSCTFIEDNYIHDNNNPNAPGFGLSPVIGVGVEISGGHFDTVRDNRIVNQGSWGVVTHDFPDSETPPPGSSCQGGVQLQGFCLFQAMGSRIYGNTFADNGFFGNPTNADVADEGTASPRDCFYDNHAGEGAKLTSDPANIENAAVDGKPCTGAGNGDTQMLFGELVCAAGFGQCPIPGAAYPQRTGVVVAPLTWHQTMDDPCHSVPDNAFCDDDRQAGPSS
jgi:hypothetical protein